MPLLDFKPKTNLKSLVFEECNIDANALHLILSIPKALKRLTLGERLYHFFSSPVPLLLESKSTLAKALELQADSLEYLMHTEQGRNATQHMFPFATPSMRPRLPTHQPYPSFPELRELDILYESTLYSVTTSALVSLQKLRVHRIPYFLLEVPWLLGAFPRDFRIFEQPNLKHIELVLREYRTDRDDTETEWLEALLGENSQGNPWTDEDARACVCELARRLRKRGIRLTVNAVRSAGYIPPFMHGEILPAEINVYDSDRMYLFGNYERARHSHDVDCPRRARMAGFFEGVDLDADGANSGWEIIVGDVD
jgi:hypothetical protein